MAITARAGTGSRKADDGCYQFRSCFPLNSLGCGPKTSSSPPPSAVPTALSRISAILSPFTTTDRHHVSDVPPSRSSKPEDKRGFLQKLAEMLHPGPDSKDELIETLVEAQDNDVIG